MGRYRRYKTLDTGEKRRVSVSLPHSHYKWAVRASNGESQSISMESIQTLDGERKRMLEEKHIRWLSQISQDGGRSSR